MFQLASLSDSAVKIAPANLGKSTLEAVTQELESLYVDKVLPECGGLVGDVVLDKVHTRGRGVGG
jgi:DNA-directed RNA polymerase subunit E'/Rpb7